ncbi:MAG TPA: helix-turn-helix transcriptional regulator [Micromonosporaceae bacterium]
MPENSGVATTRRRLRTELRRLREAAKMHQSDVVKELDWSISKLIRIENGSVGISVTDLRALAGVYRADPEAVEELVKLARVTRERHWWSAYRHVLSANYREFIGYESDATALTQMHPSIVPGLLQTEAYIRAIISGTALAPIATERVDTLVQVRLRRQQEILHSPQPPEFTVLIDEAGLRRLVGGPKVMRGQLEHLARLAEGSVRLAILPFSAGGHPGMQGAFHIMDFASPEEESVLFLETALGNPVQREQEEIAQYREAFDSMLARSLRGDEAIDFIAKSAADLA